MEDNYLMIEKHWNLVVKGVLHPAYETYPELWAESFLVQVQTRQARVMK